MTDHDESGSADEDSDAGESFFLSRQRRFARSTVLRDTLDEKERETVELRIELQKLRQELDVELPPLVARERSRLNPRTVAVVLVAIIVLAGLLLFAVPRWGASPSATSPDIAPSAAASPSASSPVKPPPEVALPWPGGPVLTPPGLTASGPGVSTPGSDVQVAVDDDQHHVDVYERVRFANPARRSVTLTRPALTGLTTGLRGSGLQIADLQVVADGVAVTPQHPGPDSWTVSSADGAPISAMVLRYRLADAVRALQPAPPGRVLAVVGPLSAAQQLGDGHPVTVRISDHRMLTISCPLAAAVADTFCSNSSTGYTGTVTLSRRSGLVALLQFDLGRAR